MNDCIIEALYPEVCNLFGDTGNLRYLQQCLPNAKIIHTGLNDEPYFIKHPVSMIYIGPMSERTQCTVIARLSPYRERIAECIANGTFFLATGNAMEVFGKQITDVQTGVTECLGLLDITTTRDRMHRFYSLVLGTYHQLQMVGFRAQFTHSTLGKTETPFLQVTKGTPMCETARIEGIQKNHFYGTYLLGPMLILNPYFTKQLLRQMMGREIPLAFEKEVIAAYHARLADFQDKRVGIH